MTAPELRTARLVLRTWRDSDAAPFAAMNADPRVMEHFPKLLTREESDAMIARIRERFAADGFSFFALEVPGVAPFVGFAGLARPSWWSGAVEVGWRLAPAYWGHGYATEAARAALDWGFATLGLAEIVAFTVRANRRSQAVMQRLGMTRDPAGDFAHPSLPVDHPLQPHWLYRLAAPTRSAIRSSGAR